MIDRLTQKTEGFTLVELMIAIVISLILLVGVLHIMLNNRTSLKTQHALAGLQSRARLLNVVLDDALASAGYHVDPTATTKNMASIFPSRKSISGSPAFNSGTFVTASSTMNKSYLRVRFQADGGLHDCYGNRIGKFPQSGNSVTQLQTLQSGKHKSNQISDFALVFKPSSKHRSQSSIKNNLYCKLYASQASITPGTHPLFSYIRAFKTLFGLDTNGNESADKFVTDLTQAQQSEVVSIRVQALLRTRQHVLSTPFTRTFHFVDGSTITVKHSQRAYLLFDRTVAVENNLTLTP